MEGLRVSKLKEGQQWGQKQAQEIRFIGEEDPLLGGEKSNRYAHSPHRAVLLLQGADLPLGR